MAEDGDLPQLTAALDHLVASSVRLPLTETALVREAEVVSLLARMRATLPPAVATVRHLREDCAAVRQRAEIEAGSILTEALEEVEHLVHDTHLLRDSRARADDILRDAGTKAEMVRAGAEALVAATLHSFYVQLNDARIVLERDIAAIGDGMAALRERQGAEPPGNHLPLRPDAELLPPDASIRRAFKVPPGETAPLPEPRGGPNSLAPGSPLA